MKIQTGLFALCLAACFAGSIGLAGCGGGGDSGSTAAAKSNLDVPAQTPAADAPGGPYSVTGAVYNLSATGLKLSNGSETIDVASGAETFGFSNKVAAGATYKVAITQQPANQICRAAYTGGTATANVTDLIVNCKPQSKWLYTWLANGDIASNALNPTNGAVTPKATFTALGMTGAPTLQGFSPSLAAHPFRPIIYAYNTRFSAVTNDFTAKVGSFNADRATGDLTVIPGSTTFAGTLQTIYDFDFKISPNGKYAYASGGGWNGDAASTVKRFTIADSNGLISYADVALIDQPAGGRTFGIALDPDGRFLYVSAMSASMATSIDTYAITADGHAKFLRSDVQGTQAAQTCGVGLAIHPDGKHLYSRNSGNTVSAYEIQASGEIRLIALNPSWSTASAYLDFVIDPTGNFIAATEAGSNFYTAVYKVADVNAGQVLFSTSIANSPTGFVTGASFSSDGKFVYAGSSGGMRGSKASGGANVANDSTGRVVLTY